MTYRFHTSSSGHLLNTAGNRALIEEMVKDAIAGHGITVNAVEEAPVFVSLSANTQAKGDMAKAEEIQRGLDANHAQRQHESASIGAAMNAHVHAAFEPAEDDDDVPHTNGMENFYANKRRAS